MSLVLRRAWEGGTCSACQPRLRIDGLSSLRGDESDRETWTADAGPPTLDHRLWSADSGAQTLVYGFSSTGSGPQTSVNDDPAPEVHCLWREEVGTIEMGQGFAIVPTIIICNGLISDPH